MLPPITITETGIQFQSYPFSAASVYGGGLLAWERVREIGVCASPPELRTHQGEVLFVAGSQQDELLSAAQQHALPCIQRADVWSWLLEPFLDSEFDAASRAATDALLAASGMLPHESAALRERFAPLMSAYNFGGGRWAWAHLGLYDLLLASQLAVRGELRCELADDFRTLYWQAMQIAERGRVELRAG